MNKRPSNHVLAQSGASLYILVICMVTLLTSCVSREQHQFESLRDFAVEFAEADTAAFAAQWKERVKSIKLDTPAARDSIGEEFAQYVRNGLYNGRHVVTIKFLRGLIDRLEPEEDLDDPATRVLLRSYVGMGAALEETGMSSVGMDYYEKGLKRAEKPEFSMFRAMFYNNIAVIFFNLGEFDNASDYFSKSLEINLKLKANPDIFLNYSNLADVYFEKGDFDKALDLSLTGLQYIKAEQRPSDFYSSHLLQGVIYSKKGNYDIAMSYLVNALKHFEKIGFVPGQIEACQKMSESYLSRSMTDSAAYYAAKSMKLSKEAGLQGKIGTLLAIEAQIAKQRGDYPQSAVLLERASSYTDSLRNAESRLRFSERDDLIPFTSTIADENQSSRLTLYLILTALVVFSIVLLLYILYIRKHRPVVPEEPADPEAGMDAELKLERRNRELTARELERLRTRENLENICTELKAVLLELNPKASAQKQRIKTILAKLDSLTEETNDEFRQCFERVNPGFYRELNSRHTDLTSRDERLCALLYLGLSTKEIAALTAREIRSVDSSRNRLRKKLNLEPTDDLTVYLKSLG